MRPWESVRRRRAAKRTRGAARAIQAGAAGRATRWVGAAQLRHVNHSTADDPAPAHDAAPIRGRDYRREADCSCATTLRRFSRAVAMFG